MEEALDLSFHRLLMMMMMTDLYVNVVRGRSHLHLTIRNIGPKLSLSLVYVLIFAVKTRVSVQCNNYTKHLILYIHIYIYIYIYNGTTPLVGLGLLVIEASRSLSETPHSVGLLSPTHRPLPGNKQHIRNRHPFPSGFRSHSPNNRVAADPLLRPLGHRDRL